MVSGVVLRVDLLPRAPQGDSCQLYYIYDIYMIYIEASHSPCATAHKAIIIHQ